MVSLPKGVLNGYKAPYPESRYAAGLASLPLMFPVYPNSAVAPHMREARKCLMAWEKPTLLIFGRRDPFYWPYYPILKNMMPMAESYIVDKGGHFLLETDEEGINHIMWNFLDRLV